MKSSERLLPETNGERELTQIHEDHRSHHRDSHSSTSRLDVGSWRTLGRARTYVRAALEHRPAHTARARDAVTCYVYVHVGAKNTFSDAQLLRVCKTKKVLELQPYACMQNRAFKKKKR